MAISSDSTFLCRPQSENRKAPSLAVRASLAIINSTVNPALRHDATNVTAAHLADVIERETQVSSLLNELRRTTDYLAWVLDHNIAQQTQREECQHYIDDARAAIAKATGGVS